MVSLHGGTLAIVWVFEIISYRPTVALVGPT